MVNFDGFNSVKELQIYLNILDLSDQKEQTTFNGFLMAIDQSEQHKHF